MQISKILFCFSVIEMLYVVYPELSLKDTNLTNDKKLDKLIINIWVICNSIIL